MRILLAVFMLSLASSVTLGQEQKPKPEAQRQPIIQSESSDIRSVVPIEIDDLPLSRRPLPVPEIGLQRALKFAESYLKKQGANLLRLHLIEAKFVFVGDEKNPAPSWHFLWRRKGSTNFLGYDAELWVFMNGSVWNPPSM
jgi:hypothetical protein